MSETTLALATLAASGSVERLDLAAILLRLNQLLKATPQPTRRLFKVVRHLIARFPLAFVQRPRIAVEFLKANVSGLLDMHPISAVLTDDPTWDNDPVLWTLAQQWILAAPNTGYAAWKTISVAMRPNGLAQEDRIKALKTALRSVYKFQLPASAAAAAPEQTPYGLVRTLIVVDQRANEEGSLVPIWSKTLRGLVPRPDTETRKRIAGFRAQADRSRVGIYVGGINSLTARYFAPGIVTGLLRAGLTVRIYSRSAPAEIQASPLHQHSLGEDVSFAVLQENDEHNTILRIAADRNWAYVDLRGHSKDHKIAVLAGRPAPHSVHMIGGGETCGVADVDALVTDALVRPSDSEFMTERHAVHLGSGIFNMATFDLPSRPSVRRPGGGPVFGAFHEYAKISSLSLDLWADALKATPGSVIQVKPNLDRPSDIPAWAFHGLKARGIAEERITILGHVPTRDDHLALFDGIDVMLDAAPFNGETTTMEALWMGIPVVSVNGNRMIARYGASILHHAGRPDLCAPTREAFGDLAASVIEDRAALHRFRSEGRNALMSTPTFNADLYADAIVDAVNELWALPVAPD